MTDKLHPDDVRLLAEAAAFGIDVPAGADLDTVRAKVLFRQDAIHFGVDHTVSDADEQIEAARLEHMEHTCQRCGSYVKGRTDLNALRYCPDCDDAMEFGKKNADGDRVGDPNPEYAAARDAAAKAG